MFGSNIFIIPAKRISISLHYILHNNKIFVKYFVKTLTRIIYNEMNI